MIEPGAAEGGDDDDEQAEVDRQQVQRDGAPDLRVEAAREAGAGRRQHERGELVAGERHARRLGRELVLLDRAQHQARACRSRGSSRPPTMTTIATSATK
jgi:hypothetical protein